MAELEPPNGKSGEIDPYAPIDVDQTAASLVQNLSERGHQVSIDRAREVLTRLTQPPQLALPQGVITLHIPALAEHDLVDEARTQKNNGSD